MNRTLFIVRPFGKNRPVIKKDKDGNPGIVFFDFDKVEADLILPAMAAAGLEGGTTQRIFEAGEIKEDMFSELLLADIVIADITIHNANVFYELGIRHALRCKTTVLIKCRGFDETPFDIIGYRYIDYDKDNPAAALDTLINFLKESPAAARKDSPVFNMLPKLQEPETEKFLAVPADFASEVALASAGRYIGRLSLLAQEAAFFHWEIPALRFIGEELFKLKAIGAGQAVWEKILKEYPMDFQANDRLATIYQRLAESEIINNPSAALTFLAKSDLVIESLLNNHPEADKTKRAEIAALKGRNAKTRWINDWKNSGPAKSTDALQSEFLEIAFKNYESGFYEDLNHFYSGINALGLLTIIIELAEQNQTAWFEGFDTNEAATKELEEKKLKYQKLATAVQLALESERRRLNVLNKEDRWLDITEADFLFLVNKTPARIAARYKKALDNAADFYREAAIKQLKIFEELNVMNANVSAVLSVLAPVVSFTETKIHYLLFTGHMIDKAGREKPRFPAAKESTARSEIKAQVIAVKNKIAEPIVGIAGGACGGDILFHEVCEELGIPTELYLALPPDQFKKESVAFAGPEWIDRFDKLYQKLPHHVLCDTKDLPGWLQKKKNYTIWERNNLWELNSALVNSGMHTTLLALWDGKGGDGAGGTEHMVKQAQERGAKVIIISMVLIAGAENKNDSDDLPEKKETAKKDIQIFVSYSSKDRDLCELLVKGLNSHLLHRSGYKFTLWSDKAIDLGANWKEDINKALAKSQAAILLVSAGFASSSFIQDNELPGFFKLKKTDDYLIFPVLVRNYNFSEFEALSTLNFFKTYYKEYGFKKPVERDKLLPFDKLADNEETTDEQLENYYRNLADTIHEAVKNKFL